MWSVCWLNKLILTFKIKPKEHLCTFSYLLTKKTKTTSNSSKMETEETSTKSTKLKLMKKKNSNIPKRSSKNSCTMEPIEPSL